jgi:hypothetical protein
MKFINQPAGHHMGLVNQSLPHRCPSPVNLGLPSVLMITLQQEVAHVAAVSKNAVVVVLMVVLAQLKSQLQNLSVCVLHTITCAAIYSLAH